MWYRSALFGVKKIWPGPRSLLSGSVKAVWPARAGSAPTRRAAELVDAMSHFHLRRGPTGLPMADGALAPQAQKR